MKRKSRGFRAFTALVALTVGALAGLALYTLSLGYRAGHRDYVEDLIYDGTRDLAKEINNFGTDGLEEHSFGIWEDESAHANCVVIDAQGKILASSGTLFIESKDHLNVMISPYERDFTEWEYHDARGGLSGRGQTGRLALLVDDAGEIEDSFGAFETDVAVGEGLPKYKTYFPAVDWDYYVQLENWQTWGAEGIQEPDPDWYDWNPRDDYDGESDPSALRLRAQTRQYAKWEQQWAQWAGQKRLIYTPLAKGQALLTLYYGDEELYREEIRASELLDQADYLGNVLRNLIILCWFLLAVWVFADARRRGERSALWGALALVGGPVTWLVYLMVRPAVDSLNACPVCGAPVKREYVCCPLCAEPLRLRCSGCGRALEAKWKVCPYCGRGVGGVPEAKSAPGEEKSDS